MLSRLFISFLPRIKHLFNFMATVTSAVILEPKKIKFLTVSTISPSICHEVMGQDIMILVFLMLSFKPFLGTLFYELVSGGHDFVLLKASREKLGTPTSF